MRSVRATIASGVVHDVRVDIERPRDEGGVVLSVAGGMALHLAPDQAVTLAAQLMGVATVAAVLAGSVDCATMGLPADPDQILERARQDAVNVALAWRATQS